MFFLMLVVTSLSIIILTHCFSIDRWIHANVCLFGSLTCNDNLHDTNKRTNQNKTQKAYRKLSLKVHPDKNSAPHADEAFKAVGLAYATLSDAQKRTIYDRYGEEDPDNRGGGAGGVHMRRRGGGGVEMTPEEIFNAFFGGGMPGGGMGGGPGGVHFYSAGFGPGMHFRGGGFPRQHRARQAQQQQQQEGSGFGTLVQLLPLIMIMLVSFFSSDNTMFHNPTARSMPGENQYFSLTVSACVLLADCVLHVVEESLSFERWVGALFLSVCTLVSHKNPCTMIVCFVEQTPLYQSIENTAQQSRRHSVLCVRQIPANVRAGSIPTVPSGAHGGKGVRKLPRPRVYRAASVPKASVRSG